MAEADMDVAVSTEPRQGWMKLILALIAFLVVPSVVFGAILPVDDTMLLFVPAMAACSLVGWFAGGRALTSLAWVGLAAILIRSTTSDVDVFATLLRGWTLLLAGAFGLICLLGNSKSFFVKALFAVGTAFLLAIVIGMLGPVTSARAAVAVGAEFARRNGEALKGLSEVIKANAVQWAELTKSFPSLANVESSVGDNLATLSSAGLAAFPALLALQSIAALALAWATYHRFSRRRIGAPLAPLREFRFNDQLVWGLIVALVILLLPTLAGARGLGLNLVVFFGALYAVRGMGVLAWFMRPGALGIMVTVGFVMLLAPFLNILAGFGFLTLGITALGLGLGDTWADWRNRARSTLS